MKTNSLRRIVASALFFILLSPFSSFSQKIHTGPDASAIYTRAQLVRESLFSELPSYIAFKTGKELDIDEVFQWMKKNMRLSDAIEFSPVRTETDNIGFTHYRYQQTFASIQEVIIWLNGCFCLLVNFRLRVV